MSQVETCSWWRKFCTTSSWVNIIYLISCCVWSLKIIPIVVVFMFHFDLWQPAASWLQSGVRSFLSIPNWIVNSAQSKSPHEIQDEIQSSPPKLMDPLPIKTWSKKTNNRQTDTHTHTRKPPWQLTWTVGPGVLFSIPGSLRIGAADIIVIPICVNQTSGLMDWKKKNLPVEVGCISFSLGGWCMRPRHRRWNWNLKCVDCALFESKFDVC